MEVKICGLTQECEAEYLNEAGADYAGFVFYEKSKRNVTVERAEEIMKKLSPNIKKVAVMVSPDIELIEKVTDAGVDVLQIHKELKPEVLEKAKLPIWLAVNVSDSEEADRKQAELDALPEKLSKKIEAIVVDAPEFGSGKPFNWSKSKRLKKAGTNSPPNSNRKFILAGGLRPENVAEGIELFKPDVVDVSSGVEGKTGKDRELVFDFIKEAKK